MHASQADPPAVPPAGVKRRVFLVEDHPIFRLGLTMLIDSTPDLLVCGQAESAARSLSLLRVTEADAVIVDLSLPGTNGLELVKHLRAEHPRLPILVLSVHDEQTYALRCLRAGASGYLMKHEADARVAEALRKVLAGDVHVSAALGELLISKTVSSPPPGAGSPLDALSDRELEILQHVGEGRSSKEIAATLHLSVKTVESHRLHLKEKLKLEDAAALLKFATDWVTSQAVA